MADRAASNDTAPEAGASDGTASGSEASGGAVEDTVIDASPFSACAVRVPCSTSNLGAGFDCLGLAFDRYLDAGFQPGAPGDPDDNDDPAGGLVIRRAGTLAELDTDPAEDIIVTTFLAELKRRGIVSVRGTLLVTSEIPVGRGLGSSGAAAVAGVALATAACGQPLDRQEALAMAVRTEGHPDNAAPSLFGGLVAVAYSGHGPRAMRLPLSSDIGWVFASPDATVSTQRARAALPEQVPHSAAVRNTARMAALLQGLANADGDALAAGFNDELHVPYRMPLIPGGKAAVEAAVNAGAWACTISGSGSGLLAACPPDAANRVLDAMLESFRKGGHGGDGFVARPDTSGVQPRDLTTLMRLL